MLLTSFVLSATPANGQDPNDPNAPGMTKAAQKCVVEMNKGVAKVAKAQGKDICKCIKDGAKGKLVGQSIEECTTADNKGKVAKAAGKLRAKVAGKCPTDPNSPDAPDFGAETPPDPNFHIQAAIDAELSLIHWIFGSDLDTAVVRINKETDKPTDPNAIPTTTKIDSKCQVGVAKAAKKCFDTKWKVFNKCKKNGLKRKAPPGPINSASDMAKLCLQDPNEDTGQPDPKGKIAKACITKLRAKIDKKCGGGVNISLAFPLFDPFGSLDLRTFVDQMVECEFCELVTEVDGLSRHCDLFDDGALNGSCKTCGDGFLDIDEECDDGNRVDNDRCDNLCQGCDPTGPGNYTLAAPLDFDTCGPLVDVFEPNLQFEDLGGGVLGVDVEVNLVTQQSTLTGPMPTCPDGSFSVTNTTDILGCCAISTLSGTYTGANSWGGSFTTVFCDEASCGCPSGSPGLCDSFLCADQGPFALTGTR